MNVGNAEDNTGLILIVDDDLDNRELMAAILVDAGHSILEASGGIQALKSAEVDSPDLILLDVMMPDLDGYDTCQQLKANEKTRDIPVIFISALDGLDDQMKGFAAGGVDYIARPFRAKEVLARVQTHMALQGLRKDLEEHVRARTVELEEANARLRDEIVERARAETVLAQERNLLRTLIDAVPDYIFIKDTDKRFILTNVAFAEALGLQPDDLIGKSSADVFPGTVATQFQDDDNQVLITGQPLVNKEHLQRDQDGQPLWMLINKIPLQDSQGEVIGLVGLSRDITERQVAQEALQESEQSYKKLYNRVVQQAQFTESLLRNMPVGVMLMSPNWKMTEVNQALCNMVGYPEEELRHRGVAYILSQDLIKEDTGFFKKVADGESDSYHETVLVCSDDSQLKVRIRAARLDDADGIPVGILSTIEDISQIEAAEEARRMAERLHIELEKEKEFGELKSRFVSMASHEFRTPLATIQATIDSLHNYYDRMSPDQRAQRFQRIRDQIKRVTVLLDDVLTIQKIEGQAEDFSPMSIDLNLFLEEYVDQVQRGKPDQPIVYSCDAMEHWTLMADKSLLQQIVASLVTNAISYSPNKEPVRVDLNRDPEGQMVIRVIDQGIGIPEAEQKYLFSNFFRGSNTTSIPGSGLGLAVAKHAVERHGGTITFESAVDVGSTFIVTLPAQQPTQSDRTPQLGWENA